MSFDSILNKPAAEIKRPPPLPAGTYTLQLYGRPNFVDMSKAGKKDYVDFPCKIVAIGDNISAEDRAAFPGGEAGILAFEPKARQGLRFYASEESAWILKEFLVNALGIDETGKTLKEQCFEAPGHMVLADCQQEPTQDGQGMTTQFRNFAKVS